MNGRLTIVLSTAMVALAVAAAKAHDPVASVTWAKDVEPLMRARCLSCHFAGGPALPTLETFEQVRDNAAAVKTAVMSRRMPPWQPVRGVTGFLHDPSLSPFQISVIASWVEARTPRGALPAAGSSTQPRHAIRQVGQTTVLEVPGPRSQGGIDRYAIELRGISGAITGWRFEPGDPTIQQAIFSDSSGRRLWTWTAGMNGEDFPAGTGVYLSPGSIVVQMYRRTHDANGLLRRPKTTPSRLRVFSAPAVPHPLKAVSIACGRSVPVEGTVYAIRPSIRSLVQVAVVQQRSSGDHVLARFRPADEKLERAYWLLDSVVLPPASTVRVEGTRCTMELTVSDPER